MPKTQLPEVQNSDSEALKGFLSALFAGTQDPIRLIIGEAEVDVTDKLSDALAQAGAEPVHLSSVTKNGEVPFLYAFTENETEDAWQDLIGVTPTVVLFKGGNMITAFALAEPAQVDDPAVISLAAFMGGKLADPLADPIPTPGANGWRMLHCDESVYTGFDDLLTAYGPGEPITDAVAMQAAYDGEEDDWAVRSDELPDLGRYHDATIRTPFDTADPRLQKMAWITGGFGVKCVNWKPSPTTGIGGMDLFCKHNVAALKDGPAVVLGKMAPGRRLMGSVEEMHFVGMDFDTGIPGDELAGAIIETGLAGVMSSTHSHLKTTTVESLQSFETWLIDQGREGEEITQAVVRQRMAAKHIEPAIVETMTFEVAGDDDDREVVISHAPIEKWRVIFPLDCAVVLADLGTDAAEGYEVWRRIAPAMAKRLGGLAYDPACVDTNRLYYLPSHPAEKPYRIDVFGGDLLSADEIVTEARALVDAEEDAPVVTATPFEPGSFEALLIAEVGGAGKAQDPNKVTTGPFDKRWAARRADGLDIVGLLRATQKNDRTSKRLRGKRGHHLTIECPYNANHSNSRDKADAGCFVVSAGDNPKADGFGIHCSHGSCKAQKRDRLDYLNKMHADGWFSEADVEAFDVLDRRIAAALPQQEPEAQAPLMAGAVAVSNLLGIEAYEPSTYLFDGSNAEDDAVEAMGKVASVVSLGNKVRIATRTKDGLVFYVKADAGLWFSSFRALVEVGADKKGEPKLKEFQALDLLLKSDKVKRYAGIDCDPSGKLPDHMLNTWEGIKIAPAPGDCSLLKRHLLASTCAGDDEHYKVLTQFFAHMFQKPTEKPGFAPVVIGPRGAGKSTVADFIRRAIGKRHSTKISQGKHLVGNFNAHLSGKLFVQAEEVTFGGDKKGEGPLKDAITSPTTLTEPKGFDPYEETSFTRFFLVTNPGHAVPAGDGERRWFVLKVRDLFEGKRLDDPDRIAYFDALRAEADNGGIAAYLDYLVNDVDISDFKPWAPPVTEALGDQARMTLSDEDAWLLDCLELGGFHDKDLMSLGDVGDAWLMDQPLEIDREIVQASYNSYVRSHNGSSGGQGAVRRTLKVHGHVEDGRRSTGGRKKTYRFGPRREWRDLFAAKFGIVLAGEGEADG